MDNNKRKNKQQTSSRVTGARFIAETFKSYGMTHVFYVEAVLRRTLVEMETLGIRKVLAHSEKAAAYMADGYARMRHGPGICMSQSVGAANLAAGLQDAFLARSPVIAITGHRPPLARYSNAYQEIIHGPLFAPVTKYNVEVEVVEQLPNLLRQAFREATTGSPGPVHLDIMEYIKDSIETVEADLQVVDEKLFSFYPPHRPAPERKSVEEAVRLLESAEKPVIVAGGGATASAAGPEIVKLAEKMTIPVATSLTGKGIIPEDHPLSIGPVGTYSRSCANRVVFEADLVLYIGSRTGDQVTNMWKVPRPGTQLIQIDINPSEPGRNYPNTLSVIGDAKVCVNMIEASVTHKAVDNSWVCWAQGLIREWHNKLEPLRNSKDLPIRPERLCRELTNFLPSNGILVVDTGYSGIWTGTMVYITNPGQRYIRSAGSLGWAFPASLGVKCAATDRPVICFTGDGGFWYHLSELETARRYGLNTITVVNNNSGLMQCANGVDAAYGDRPGNRESFYRFCDINFARIADEIGCLGIRVEHPDQIAGALGQALSSAKPVVIDVVTDPKGTPLGPWTPA
ncbi:Acetolactate synthase large subunit [subsurface metagenome]